jgi:beta-lactamase superfamily II metal-dependent hydrolase
MPIRVITFNVEHGSCHAIFSTDNRVILIDLGWSPSFSPLAWLKSQGIKTIDLLVVTHPHADHIQNIFDLKDFEVQYLFRSAYVPDQLIKDLDPLLKYEWQVIDSRYTAPIPVSDRFFESNSQNKSIIELSFWGGYSSTKNLNNYSLVTLLDYFGLKCLFPGDIEYDGWSALMQDPLFIKAVSGLNILVASHHGRQEGWCAELFDYFTPQLVIISDGSAKETSYTSEYSKRTLGSKVKAVRTGEIKVKKVVSTRDNGHIDINAWLKEETDTITGIARFPWIYTVTVDKF